MSETYTSIVHPMNHLKAVFMVRGGKIEKLAGNVGLKDLIHSCRGDGLLRFEGYICTPLGKKDALEYMEKLKNGVFTN